MKCPNILVGSVPIINNRIIWPASNLMNNIMTLNHQNAKFSET